MRNRFKFRFWFKDTQEMVYSEKFNDVQTLGQWLFEDRKDVVKMQCTGLKDKNSKLIYESDILLDIASHHKPLYVVKWNKSQAQFYIEMINPKKYELYAEWHLGRHDLDYEVIGNIYLDRITI